MRRALAHPGGGGRRVPHGVEDQQQRDREGLDARAVRERLELGQPGRESHERALQGDL